jgi:protein-disulfide isomerase
MIFMRNVLKYAVTYAAVLLISISVFAATGGKKDDPKPADVAQAQAVATGPSKELAEAYFKRMFGYDPGIDVKVVNIGPSPIAELSEVSIVVVTPEGQQSAKWYVSKDLQHVIVGEVLPFGADPFATERAELAKSAFGPTKGPADAKMLIVEFADLECPACKEAAPLMEKLRNDFPQARFVFQSFPLPQHPWAVRASSYLDCIARENQEQAFAFIEAVFSHQKEIEDAVRKTDASGKPTVDDAAVTERLRQYTTIAGADPAKTEACAATEATAERITRSELLGKAVGITGTPTLFVNGRRIGNPTGAQYEALKNVASYEAEQAAAGK